MNFLHLLLHASFATTYLSTTLHSSFLNKSLDISRHLIMILFYKTDVFVLQNLNILIMYFAAAIWESFALLFFYLTTNIMVEIFG